MKEEDIKILGDYIDKYSNKVFKKYESRNRPLFLGDFSFEYIQRFFGSKINNKIFDNDILISPFIDPIFHKIQVRLEGAQYSFPLVALVYIRFFEGLLDFKFETDSEPRIITEEEIIFAK